MHDFILTQGARLIGLAVTFGLAAGLIWKNRHDFSVRRSLAFALACIAGAMIAEYLPLPLTVMYEKPLPPLDKLTFKSIQIGSTLVAMGYAFLILAAYRWIMDVLGPVDPAEDKAETEIKGERD